MSDMGDNFKMLRDESKAKRAANRERAPELLRAAGLPFVERNHGAHLIVADNFDFWPGTGKWRDKRRLTYGRGIATLIRAVKVGR